jgi:hypothetical protein
MPPRRSASSGSVVHFFLCSGAWAVASQRGSVSASQFGPSGSHLVQFDQLCTEAQARLREINKSDLESLFSVRIAGEQWLWGIKDIAIVRVLWWDHEHSVCLRQKNIPSGLSKFPLATVLIRTVPKNIGSSLQVPELTHPRLRAYANIRRTAAFVPHYSPAEDSKCRLRRAPRTLPMPWR